MDMLKHNLMNEIQNKPELRGKYNKLLQTKYSVKRSLKVLAQKQQPNMFLRNSDKIVKRLTNYVDNEISYHDTYLYQTAEKVVAEVKEYSTNCWFYCQGNPNYTV